MYMPTDVPVLRGYVFSVRYGWFATADAHVVFNPPLSIALLFQLQVKHPQMRSGTAWHDDRNTWVETTCGGPVAGMAVMGVTCNDDVDTWQPRQGGRPPVTYAGFAILLTQPHVRQHNNQIGPLCPQILGFLSDAGDRVIYLCALGKFFDIPDNSLGWQY